ncbi:nitrilase-related carbon-nitrogen hydrolase [Pigmentibacter sp. JX0631]|uniref:nitrilase-related carbon-nitrogen hydrolase n=1 Tax=Pigmentibacter sp. JX0631 TaxID=2976982 RepID=UPI002469AA77|nr:nitrilase-related carbon-nitrogen hydrolase [Pigmentibacter sp. JX0631]WGL58923.1 nitrilase-related carbon-nitrogen hydrolase [Pigmentibacter sp. JX0631]
MLISCIQTNPQNDVKENVRNIISQIKIAAQEGSEVIVLPEMFSYMGDEKQRKYTKSKLKEDIFKELQDVSKENNIILVAGSHSEEISENPEKVFNTCVTYNKSGELISIYRKLHLFNLKDADGKPLYCESNSYEYGSMAEDYTLVTSEGNWKALNIICYDLRFPENIRNQKNFPFDIIFVPAAFTWQTGKEHWEILLRARAIENQCYVVACNQTGFFYNNQKRNYGNSMVIDPWGQIVARMGEEVGILSAQISKDKILESRAKLPAIVDRKIR